MESFLEKQIISTTAERTEEIASSLGQKLSGGEVIELVSDLGGGKTTFVRGLMRGLGSSDKVSSPTFTISKVYAAGSLEVHHFDFYRLQEPGIIADELAEVVSDPKIIVVVEWADAVQHVLPLYRVTITISQTSEGYRKLVLTAPEHLATLLEGIA